MGESSLSMDLYYPDESLENDKKEVKLTTEALIRKEQALKQ
jgi:hypothetical protein